jgi:O-acetyl-ADP-ribose deacetylase (regulator of RNase III)
MIRFTTGNLLEADVDALVNTVNTVGVMGKGIALMFKEAFPENFRAYAAACKMGEVQIGRMFVTERSDLVGPRFIINFPTKKDWKHPSKLEWVEEGLAALNYEITARGIRSIAIPPLGAGNGGLDWYKRVRPLIERTLSDVAADIVIYEPTLTYQNIVKRSGVERLTPARALMAEMIRRYAAFGIDCTILEAQKLAWFLKVAVGDLKLGDPLRLDFKAFRYGPYADDLRHLLNTMDGSYLHCEKRINDAKPLDSLWFHDDRSVDVRLYLTTDEAKPFQPALNRALDTIQGFQSPFGMELLATLDWLHREEHIPLETSAMLEAIAGWNGPDEQSAKRKVRLFQERDVGVAVARLVEVSEFSV